MKWRVGLVSLIVCWNIALSAAWSVPKAVWSPNKAMIGQLAPASIIGAYKLQPPKGYVLQTLSGPGGATAQSWAGTLRPDGTRPFLMLTIFTPPTGEENKYTLAQVAAKMLGGIERRRKNWKQSPSENGTINGLTFVRTYWRGTDTVTGLAMHGFSYVAQDGKGFLQLSSQDVEPYTKTSLLLTEAAALTFRKH